MTKYLSNAFSLNMVAHLGNHRINIKNIKDPESIAGGEWTYAGDSRQIYAKKKVLPLYCIVGHDDIMSVINDQLGLSGESIYRANRESVRLEIGDLLLVAQYVGQRLPEGATKLPAGAKIEWLLIEIAADSKKIEALNNQQADAFYSASADYVAGQRDALIVAAQKTFPHMYLPEEGIGD